MFQIGDTLVSLDIIERQFICDLPLCKGACCVEGDAGAPLEQKELAEIHRILPAVWNDLSKEAQDLIRKQGVAYIDSEGDTVTSILNGKDCVFTCFDAAGICRCAIEKAYREGRTRFMKPVSCHLYPIRVTPYKSYKAVNFNQWKICKAAEVLGKKERLPLYKFLKEPLIRKFGEAWYEELDKVATEWLRQHP